uniref:Type I restriction endonuclease EcoKI subunit S n=1 Tax=Marinobacter nauticus TaxID=2743 RepID=A0A455W7Q1_MARNT|nr:type I restriction endonuclease EcoKI subunit S [Marinobacter nauticus]
MSLVMYPDSWTEITLGEINQYRSKNVQPKDFPEESFELWSVPIFPTGKPEILLGTEIGSSKQAVEPRDVLICKINPRINRVWEVGQKSSYRQIASSEWIVIRQPLMEPRYLLRFFQSDQFRTKLCADVTGVGGSLTRAQPKKVATFPVVVPPLAEQKVIADKLDTLLAQVENTKARLERIPQILKRFRQSVLAAAVSGRLTEEWRGSPDLTGWESGELSRFIEKPRYGSSAKSQKSGDIPVLRMGNLQDGKLDWADLVYTSDPEEIEKYRLEPGDVLFNRTNSPELVGKTSIFKGERDAIYAGYLIKIKCLPSLNAEFLNYQLNSPKAKDYCKAVKSDGVSQSNINAKKLAAYPLSCPPIEEQTEIVRRVDQLFAHADRIEQQVNNALARVNNLTQSILAKAFRGELTEQWRKDNPELISGENSAEALLERIRSERAAQKPTRRRTKIGKTEQAAK